MQMVTMKRPITIRLDEDLLELLKQVSECEGTMYYDRDRTWLIEKAITEQYQPLLDKGRETDANGGKQKAS